MASEQATTSKPSRRDEPEGGLQVRTLFLGNTQVTFP